MDPEERALAEAKSALGRGGSPHDVIEPVYGLTRMHVAARNGHVRLLRYLIDRGGDVEIPNTGGRGVGGETPLHWASTGDVVDLLLGNGADPVALGPAGQEPLASMALRNRQSAVIRMVAHGTDVDAQDSVFGNSVVITACSGLTVEYGDPALDRYEDRMAIIEHLVLHGANVNAQNHDAATALHVAAQYDARFVALLLRLGANPTVKDKNGKLPIDLSRESRLAEAVKLLEGAMKR